MKKERLTSKNLKDLKKEEGIKEKEKEYGIIEPKESVTTLETCPNCGAKKCTRVRSFYIFADEPEVTILKCLECGKNFRSGSGVSGY